MQILIEGWVCLLVLTMAVVFYRKWVARREDDTIHLSEAGTDTIRRQATLAKQLERIDVTGKALTVALILYTLAAAGRIVYLGWVDSTMMK